MHTEILTTLLVFLSSANREIVKSTLGYIKLVVHTLPAELLRPHLAQIVPALLRWSNDSKNHFKPKVRHVFERMIRRFGWEDVYGCAAEEEGKKMLVNIRKRKERAKRKRAAAQGQDDDEDVGLTRALACTTYNSSVLQVQSTRPATGDAFEDVLYGSESELEESDDERPSGHAPASKTKSSVGGARIRVDDDEPMDLLEGVVSRITSTPLILSP
jgi:ribosomal RNA-processing protein 12